MSGSFFNRRQLIGGALGGFFAFAARNRCDQLFARTQGAGSRAKRCIVLWMNGGPSQIDTFDPKPGKSTAQFAAIDTAAAGLQISSTLPLIAKHMDALSIIRNLSSPVGDHQRAQYFMHTGFQFASSFPRPALGSVISRESTHSDIPHYIALGAPGFGPAYLGPDHAPFSIENAAEAQTLLKNLRRRRGRLQLLSDLGNEFDKNHKTPVLDSRRNMVSRIEELTTTPLVGALDLESVSTRDRARYGDSPFARWCLVARRLLDIGVSFVEIQREGWDTHANNQPSIQRLCQDIDRPWSALMEDLKSSGMIKDTIVVWMGEFGRTPSINTQNGRDHFPQVTPAVIGGGPFAGGRIIGKTNGLGTAIEGSSHQIPDLFATIMSAFGIEPDREYTTEFDSPTTATDKGQVIQELT